MGCYPGSWLDCVSYDGQVGHPRSYLSHVVPHQALASGSDCSGSSESLAVLTGCGAGAGLALAVC